MTLRHMSRGLLSIFAGGNPWKVNETLQSGRPTQIGDLAQAFLEAWTHDGGQHPITDSAEVQRTVSSLGLQAEQLPLIAVDLETIAAALAQTRGTASGYINCFHRAGKSSNPERALGSINLAAGCSTGYSMKTTRLGMCSSSKPGATSKGLADD